jgi:hypothetical protein
MYNAAACLETVQLCVYVALYLGPLDFGVSVSAKSILILVSVVSNQQFVTGLHSLAVNMFIYVVELLKRLCKNEELMRDC